jgi:hypothetical protein
MDVLEELETLLFRSSQTTCSIFVSAKTEPKNRQVFENAIEFANSGCRAKTTQAIPRFTHLKLGIEFWLDSPASYQIHRFSRAWTLKPANSRFCLVLHSDAQVV